MTLKELLQEWKDDDVAAYLLACSLGLMNYDETMDQFREHKGVFWTDNKLNNFLHSTLTELADMNVLEYDEDKSAFRWNNSSSN